MMMKVKTMKKTPAPKTAPCRVSGWKVRGCMLYGAIIMYFARLLNLVPLDMGNRKESGQKFLCLSSMR